MKKRMIIMLVLTGLLFGGVFGMQWVGKRMMNEFLDSMPVPPVTISAQPVEAMVWNNHLQAVGSLVAVNGADITSEVEGIVTAIHFESGQQVAKGDLLLSLDSEVERAELVRLEAQAELAEIERTRRESLYKRQTISRSEYDTAVAETRSAEASVAAQRGRLAQKEIRAPFSGRLGVRRVNVGQYLGAGEAIVTLQSLNPIDIDFTLPESRLGSVQTGLPVEVVVSAWPDRVFSGEVLAIEPKVEAGTRNFTLRARLDNPEGLLRPGQFGHVRLKLSGEREVVVVPRTAIHYNSYGTSVYILRHNPDARPRPEEPAPGMPPWTDLEVSQRFVETGDARGDFVAVVKGLKAGEKVVTSGLMKLRNGQPVIVNNRVVPEPKLQPEPGEG